MTTMTSAAPIAVTTRRPRLLTAAVARLFAVEFAAMCGFYLLLSVVPLYATDRGIGSAGAGVSTAVLMFAAVAAELATPAVAARLGYRRLLVGGLVLLGAPALLLPTVTNLGTLMAVSIVRGVGFAIVVVAVGALATTVIPAQRRGEGLGVLGVVAMLPAVLALPAGVWLAGRFGYVVVFGAGGAAALLAVLFAVPLPGCATGAGHPAGVMSVVRRPAILLPALVFVASAIGGGAIVAFLPSAVAEGVAVPALFVQAAVATLIRWLAGRYSDRHDASWLLVPAVLLSAMGLAAAALTGSPAAVLAGMAVFGAGFGLAQATSLTTMLRRVSSPEYGAVSAAWNAAYDLGWGAGALGIGLVVAGAGYSAGFIATAILALAALPLARRGRR